MYNFTVPKYKGKNIANLMSSIAQNFSAKHSYKELDDLPSKQLQQKENIILIIIDGLGYNYLQTKPDSFLYKHLHAKMTSTFLSTTACANTTFAVGYPPQQTALTGWDINMKEIGAVTTILPFVPIYGGAELSKSNFLIKDLIEIDSLHKNFAADCIAFLPEYIFDTPFSNFVTRNVNTISVSSVEEHFEKIAEILKSNQNRRRFLHSYIPEFDSLAHKKGINSNEVSELFYKIDSYFEKYAAKFENSKLIVTSDHGFVDISPETELWVEDFPGLNECLTTPIAGDQRVRDCFVRPRKLKDFEEIVENQLREYCWCFKGEQLIADNFYGLGKPNKKLWDRVGDYVLIMKENYTLRQKLANYKKPKNFQIGKHGGVTEDEMFVPLIVWEF